MSPSWIDRWGSGPILFQANAVATSFTRQGAPMHAWYAPPRLSVVIVITTHEQDTTRCSPMFRSINETRKYSLPYYIISRSMLAYTLPDRRPTKPVSIYIYRSIDLVTMSPRPPCMCILPAVQRMFAPMHVRTRAAARCSGGRSDSSSPDLFFCCCF